MDNRELEELGDRIQDIIDNAVSSQDYQKLNQNITKVVEKAIKTGNTAWKNVTNANGQPGQNMQGNYKQYRYVPPQEFQRNQQMRYQAAPSQYMHPAVYAKTSNERTKAILMVVGGVILGAIGGIHLMAAGIVGALFHPGQINMAWTSWVSLLGGAGLITAGVRSNSRITRFQQYISAIGNASYVNIDRLAAAVRKPKNYVRKDIKKLIDKGWFVEGHLDKKETCLITNNETYQLYEESERQLEERQKEEAKKQEVLRKKEEEDSPKKMSKEVQEIWDKGHEYLDRIHQNNLDIPGVEISAKISHMEELVTKILEGTKEHPENAGDLKKLMNYYLPMTIKLLDVYEEMDRQPVQGENIRKSKAEIEETMDTLNAAFEKMLDSIFQETAIDVSSDISVLNTMLAQEGYAEDEIQRVVRKQ